MAGSQKRLPCVQIGAQTHALTSQGLRLAFLELTNRQPSWQISSLIYFIWHIQYFNELAIITKIKSTQLKKFPDSGNAGSASPHVSNPDLDGSLSRQGRYVSFATIFTTAYHSNIGLKVTFIHNGHVGWSLTPVILRLPLFPVFTPLPSCLVPGGSLGGSVLVAWVLLHTFNLYPVLSTTDLKPQVVIWREDEMLLKAMYLTSF